MNTRPAVADWARWGGEDLLLRLRIQPSASIDGFAECLGDQVKLRIKAPPADGKANTYLIALLSVTFGVGKRAVIIETGRTSLIKRVRIQRPTRMPPEIRR